MGDLIYLLYAPVCPRGPSFVLYFSILIVLVDILNFTNVVQMASDFQLREYGQDTKDLSCNALSSEPKMNIWSKFKLVWFLLFSILGLGTTIAVSFGCISVATSNLYIYSIRPAALLEGLMNAPYTPGGASNSSSTTTEGLLTADFGIANLPDQYFFGISGLCRHWNQSDETRCQHRFPQVPLLLAAVLEDSDSASVRDSWTQLLTSTNMSSDSKTLLWKRCITAVAGLLITSILWASFTILWTLFRPAYLTYSIYLAIFDAIMALTTAILWLIILNWQGSALRAAAPGISNTLQHEILEVGPGLALLWGLASSKLMVTPLMLLLQGIALLSPVLCCCMMFDTALGGGGGGGAKQKLQIDYRYYHQYNEERARKRARRK